MNFEIRETVKFINHLTKLIQAVELLEGSKVSIIGWGISCTMGFINLPELQLPSQPDNNNEVVDFIKSCNETVVSVVVVVPSCVQMSWALCNI